MHTPIEELKERLDIAKEKVEVGSIYFHYKSPDMHYRVTDVAIFEEDEEPCIVYQSLHDHNLVWVRKISSWTSMVEYEGRQVSRFQKIS